MLTVYSVVAVIFVALAACVAGDDTEGLRFALNTLCDVNKEGIFAKCCQKYPVGSVVIDDKDTWSCYMNEVVAEDSIVVSLNFDSKGLTDLGVGAFSKLTHLVSLDVGNSNIRVVKKGALDGLNNLVFVNFMLSKIQELEAGVFDNLSNLNELHLYTNSLHSLPSGIFASLSNLQVLDMDYNSITSLPDGLFDSFSNVYAMDISSNPFVTLPPTGFSSMTNLILLLAHDNGYTELPGDMFPKDSHLVWLDIHSNNLTSLSSETFKNLKGLQTLNLGSNYLTEVTPELFSNCPLLTDISLNNNGITSLPAGFFDDFTNLKFFDLSENSLAFLDMGNTTPETFIVKSNKIASFSQEAGVIANGTIRMALQLKNNCLLPTQIPAYRSPYVHVVSDNQLNCPDNYCNEDLRATGCLECSGGACTSCLNGYILFNGKCVPCVDSDDCPFANNNEIHCVNDDDLTNCPIPNAVACRDHVCVEPSCLESGSFSATKECEIGGMGCKGCRCMEGWYAKKDKDCQPICGDDLVVGPEECDGSLGCNNKTCKCDSDNGYVLVQHGPRKKCVLKTETVSTVSVEDIKKIKLNWKPKKQTKKWQREEKQEL